MEKKREKQTGKGKRLPENAAPVCPPESVQADDVERVLEHVSSPFRWELLEVPVVKPAISMPKKHAQQKSR